MLFLAVAIVVCVGACAGVNSQPIVITISLQLSQQLTQPVSVEIVDGAGRSGAGAAFEAAWDYPPGYRTGDPEPPESGAPTELQVPLPEPGRYTFNVSAVVVGYPCGTCMSGYKGGSFEFIVDDADHVELPIGDLDWMS